MSAPASTADGTAARLRPLLRTLGVLTLLGWLLLAWACWPVGDTFSDWTPPLGLFVMGVVCGAVPGAVCGVVARSSPVGGVVLTVLTGVLGWLFTAWITLVTQWFPVPSDGPEPPRPSVPAADLVYGGVAWLVFLVGVGGTALLVARWLGPPGQAKREGSPAPTRTTSG